MSKLITREAFKISLKAIKDYIEKKLKSVLSETKIIAEDIIKSASKEFATKSELDSKLDLDNSAQNDHVAIFKLTDTGVNLLDSGYVIGNNDLGNVKVAYPVIGTGSYGSTASYVYGYTDTNNFIGGAPGDSSTDVQTLVYSDSALTLPIGRIIYGAPYVLCHFNTPGDITSGYNHTRNITGIGSDYYNPIIVERVIENNTIATEKGVEEYVDSYVQNKFNLDKDYVGTFGDYVQLLAKGTTDYGLKITGFLGYLRVPDSNYDNMWNPRTEEDRIIYSDESLTFPIGRFKGGSPWTYLLYSIPGDTSSELGTEEFCTSFGILRKSKLLTAQYFTELAFQNYFKTPLLWGASSYIGLFGYNGYYTYAGFRLNKNDGLPIEEYGDSVYISFTILISGDDYKSYTLFINNKIYTKYLNEDWCEIDKYGKITHIAEDVSNSNVTLNSDTFTIIDTSISQHVTFLLNVKQDEEIRFLFKVGDGFSCEISESISWANDNVPTWEAGKTYEISIFNNLAVYTSYVV